MTLEEKFAPVRASFISKVNELNDNFAHKFGYPENPGILMDPINVDDVKNNLVTLAKLPKRISHFPPVQRPETWFEVLFGPAPRVDAVPRYLYETQDEGFYNFYIENYRNIYFLPDWLSEFIQVQFNVCLDISSIEVIREVVFVGFVLYSQLIILRIAISWFLYINPYTFPWSYITTAVDWTEEILQGVMPSFFGVNITGSFFLGGMGLVADSLNHLVFTMPFLPSEGEPTQLLIHGKLRDVIIYHYLPALWYKHPIPNDLREFWVSQRPDILTYMTKAYGDLNLHLLPDSYIINQQEMVGFSVLTDNFHIIF